MFTPLDDIMKVQQGDMPNEGCLTFIATANGKAFSNGVKNMEKYPEVSFDSTNNEE